MKVAVFYGSSTGNTEEIAIQIQQLWGADQVELFDVADTPVSVLQDFDHIILGVPTWDYGQIQADWSYIWEQLDELDLSDRSVALFGMGDQLGYGEWFLDAMGLLHDKVLAAGATTVGAWPVAGYNFEASRALNAEGDCFVGLALDEDCQPEMTEERLETWLQSLQAAWQLNLSA